MNISDKVLSNDNMPHYINYDYNIGYSGANKISSTMTVKMSLPRSSFVYLPVPREPSGETEGLDIPSKVVSIDEVVDFYQYMNPANAAFPSVARQDISEKENNNGGGSSGGGCNSGIGTLAIAVIFLSVRFGVVAKVFGLFLCVIICSVWVCNPSEADYILPIEHKIYTISGTCTTDIELTQELKDKIASEWDNAAIMENKLSASDFDWTIRLYPASGSWTVRPSDLYSLAANGEYGGAVLPVIAQTSSKDIYVVRCTFSEDIQPQELIAIHGFRISTDEYESVSNEDEFYLLKFIALDDNYNRVDAVPDNRKIYIAFSMSPEYINSGIITAVRGELITEEEPLYRLTPGAAQRIAEQLGISPND